MSGIFSIHNTEQSLPVFNSKIFLSPQKETPNPLRIANKHWHTIVHSNVIYRRQKVERTHPSITGCRDGWMSRMWYVHTIEYDSAMKRNCYMRQHR
jgi:hypothetical protein